ncbi:helix-turn-helix domain-containing protein [Actinomadura alba]|uniref:Helix-turn-helix domain-containing protein n=1 Tax=Actinomadura alba TaxID=406431 RepID=A0ABR7LNH7_9ACTN|nr:helix-turn-helix transcriptional regulator [Actinomadura alba]MBC6466399.1 helix-turn-helix domain-containing protein [Actinomadura alba]
MPPGYSPTLRNRRLRALLRHLREQRGMTLEQAARQVDWTGAKLSRIETGQRGAHPNDVRALTDVYEVTGEEREALIRLAREARQRGWWQPYGSALPSGFETYVGLESEASGISAYAPELIPGLMQTEDYARAQMRAAPVPDSDEEIDKRIAVRITRQARLTSATPPELWVILNEAVLHRQVGGPATLRAQHERIIDLAQQPTITVQILPFSSGAHPATHGAFVSLGFPQPEDVDVVYVEYLTGRAFLEAPDEIARYTLVLNHLRASALSPDDSLTLIRTLARKL